MSQVKLGDIVQPIDGGPRMVVCEIKSPVRIRCMWIEDGRHLVDAFHPKAVKVVERNDPESTDAG